MNKAFKVAIAIRNILGKNGASRIVLEQARRFVAHGEQVYLYVSRYNKDIIDKNIMIEHFYSLNPIKQIRRKQYALRFQNVCAKYHIDLPIGNGDTLSQKVLFMHNLVELELKVTQNIDNLANNNTFALHDKILKEKNFELLVCNSRLMKNFIQEKYSISNDNTIVLYPGYDPKKFNTANKAQARDTFKKRYGINKDYIVGFVTSGNLKKRGIDIFFETLLNIPKKAIDSVAFVVVGKEKNFGGYLEKYPQFAAYSIYYIEPLDDVENIFKSLDILIHPALIEEFGMVVLESYACGVPVISSKKVGASEIFFNNLPELIIQEPNAIEFSKKIIDLINNRQKCKKFSLIAESTAKNYTWDHYFAKLFDIYEQKNLIPQGYLQK